MTVKERFTDEEWRLVLHIPFDAFIFAAGADGNVEETEVKAFLQSLEKAPMLTNDLHREIALHHAATGTVGIGAEITFEMKESGSAMDERFDRTKRILKQRLTPAEYQDFFKSIFLHAIAIAGASHEKKRPFHKAPPPINDKEAKALNLFAMKWDIDTSFIKAMAS
jgi:hypothetical protein